MTTALASLAVLTDEQLAERFAAGEVTAAELDAVVAYQERAERARQARKAGSWGELEAQWEAEALAQYERFEQVTHGYLLSAAGEATGREAFPMLWEGSEEEARKLASLEVIRLWDHDERRPPGKREYCLRAFSAERGAAEEAAESGERDEGEMLGHIAGAVIRAGVQAPRAGMSTGAPQPPAHQRRAAARPVTESLAVAQWAAGGCVGPKPGTGGAAGTVAVRESAALERSVDATEGVRALNLLSGFHQHYDYWEAPEFADLLAGWELQTHAVEDDGSPIWRALARLIVAGMHGTGKDGTMAQIAMATGSSVLMKVTYPGIRDCIAKDREAAILNEAQMTFGTTGRAAQDVRVIVNAHVKGNMIRDGKHGKMNVFGQVAMAGLPKLLTGKIAFEIEDTLSRCFILWKTRKPKDVTVPEVTDEAERQIREEAVPAMREWCAANRPLLRQRAAWFGAGNPTGLPDLGGGGRGNDQLARSLLTVCDVATALAHQAWTEAGNDPGEFPAEWNWYERIRRAIVFVSGVPAPVEDGQSPLEGTAAALEEMWATERSGEDILASMAPGLAITTLDED